MNLLNRKWINRNNLNVIYQKNKMIIENNSNSHSFLVYPKVFKASQAKEVSLKLDGNLISGTGCTLRIINRRRQTIGQCGLCATYYNKFEFLNYFILCLYIPGNSKIEITKVEYSIVPLIDINKVYDSFTSDTLLITPGYPSLENKYNTAFVHTRVKSYLNSGMNVDVIVCNELSNLSLYEFDNIKIFKCSFYHLRELLKVKHYSKILIHFFNDQYANVLESIDLSNTKLYFYLHGAETLYWDWPKIASQYFEEPAVITNKMKKQFMVKDYFIKKYNNLKNAKWIFVTNWTKEHCEELLDIKFNNWDVIPCLIDTDLFKYDKKDPELRKKIFVLRKFDDINSYSLDTVVRIILELSRRECFKDLQFDIYGDGSMHDRILAPLRKFDNVNIVKKFLTHEEIRKVHTEHGIALFPTRFDSQAVSSCEAASSGCAVVTSNIPGVRQFIPDDLGVLCDVENYKEYADVIEKMYYDSNYFQEVGERESQSVQSKFDYSHTIQKDIDLYKEDNDTKVFSLTNMPYDTPVLSVIIPSYNVEAYLRHTVFSILDQENAHKIEVIIINDGSKDNTLQIANELKEKYSINGRSLIRVIDKENGGHGSTINVGIKEARGKYIKIVDGDDTLDSEEFAKLINILENEDSDIVLNDYIEDYAKTNNAVIAQIYGHLKPGIKYHFDDLCNEDYGFTSWGPILACSSYKTEMLRNR